MRLRGLVQATWRSKAKGFSLPMVNAFGGVAEAVDGLGDGCFGLAVRVAAPASDLLGLEGAEDGEEGQKTVQWTVFPT